MVIVLDGETQIAEERDRDTVIIETRHRKTLGLEPREGPGEAKHE